jgi:ribose transport system permease protein
MSTTAAPPAASPLAVRIGERAGSLWTLGVLIAIIAGFSFTTTNFLTQQTWLAVSVAATQVLLLAVGQTFVVVSRGIDLSVGGVLGLSGMACGLLMSHLMHAGWSDPLTITLGGLAALAAGAILGTANGLVITRMNVTPLIATLAMLGVAQGITQLLNHGQELADLPVGLGEFGNKVLLGDWLPVPVLICAVITIAAALVLHRTRFGRRTFAIGSNPEAALRMGVNVRRHVTLVFLVSGALAGVTGFLVTAQLSAASVTAGSGSELESITAVVIGGASLFGGRGTIAGAVIGTAIIAVLETGLVIARVSAAWQLLAVGLILVAAVWADQQRLRLARRARAHLP